MKDWRHLGVRAPAIGMAMMLRAQVEADDTGGDPGRRLSGARDRRAHVQPLVRRRPDLEAPICAQRPAGQAGAVRAALDAGDWLLSGALGAVGVAPAALAGVSAYGELLARQ